MRFRIPDFPLGGLAITILFAIGLLAAFPDMPYGWVWEAVVALGAITWAIGSGILDRREGASSPKSAVPGRHIAHELSTDFAALINAITAQGDANRQEERTEDDGRKLREWLTIGLLIGTVYLLNNQVTEMKRVYDPIKGQADAAVTQADAAKAQAAVAKTQADAAIEAAKAAKENTIAAERAWVGPNGATIDTAPVAGNTPVAGNPVNFVITYQNSGREPAINFTSTADPFIVTTEDNQDGVITGRLVKDVNDCLAKKPIIGTQVVYPSTGFASNQLTVTFDKSKIDDKVISGEKTLVVSGCFVYETFGSSHHSTFCFYYHSGVTKGPNLAFCPSGAFAD